MHPGTTVRQDCLEKHGLSVTDAARILGVDRQTLSNLLNARSGISPEMAVRLEKAFGIKINQAELMADNVLNDPQYVQDGKVTVDEILRMVTDSLHGCEFVPPHRLFQTGPLLGTGEEPLDVAVADLDGDRLPDLLTANPTSGDVSILFAMSPTAYRRATALNRRRRLRQ